MKFAWITFIFIFLCDKVKTRPSTESNVVNKTLTLNKGKSVISQTIQQHETLPSHSSHIELTIKNRLMPKFQIKYTSVENKNNSTFKPTTRRPLMRYRKFTSKPHAIYYIHTRTPGEQSNFSKRRTYYNVKKRFKPENNIKNTPNTSEDSSSVEDRFKNFTDVGNIGELVEPERKVSTNRQSNRRRGYLIAASEQSKSVALYTLQNTNKYRSKSRSAIHASLQKIKTIRPGMKRKSITTKTVPSQTKVNEDTQENKTVSTSEKFVHGETITEKFVYLTTVADKVLNLPITTEKSILSASTTKNIQETLNKSESSIESTDKIKISSKSDSGIIKSMPLIIATEKSISIPEMHKTVATITNSKFVTTEKTPIITTTTKLDNTVTISENRVSSEAKKENSDNIAVVTEQSVDTGTKIQKSDTVVTKTDIADHSSNLAAVGHSLAQTRKTVDLAITTEKSDELTTKTQKSVDFDIKTETSGISMIITENPTDKIVFSDNSDLVTVKSVPLIIVTTDTSISLSDVNDTIIEAITNGNIVMPMEILDPKIREFKENIITVSPILNEEEITTTEGDGNHSAMRRKRRINIIEEERTASPSTKNSFSERETHIGADLTYRNIHT